MKPVCAICGKEITASDNSEEHIIPASLGGRRTVSDFLHGHCNNEAGATWDGELAKQLQPLILNFGVKRQGGQALKMKVATTAGEEFLLGPGGSLEMLKPIIEKADPEIGNTYKIQVGSRADGRKVLNGLKRKHPEIDIEASLACIRVEETYLKAPIQLNLQFGGEESGRSLVKSTLALAYDAGLPVDLCQDALGYLRGSKAPCFGYYYTGDLIVERPTGVPLHCIAIEARPDTGLILGYAEYFGINRAVVCLGHGYQGEPVRKVYAIDPRTGMQLDLAVDLPFNEEAIKAIYDYQMDNDAGRKAAYDAVWPAILEARRNAEWERVAREGFKYAWDNCGAKPDAILTIIDKVNIVRLFCKKLFPFLTQVLGLDAHTSLTIAVIVGWEVLNSAESQSAKVKTGTS